METEIVRIPSDAARAGELERCVRAARGSFLSAPRCRRFRVLRSALDDEIVIVIDWASAEAHAAALDDPTSGAFLGAVRELAAGPPTLATYVDVEANESA